MTRDSVFVDKVSYPVDGVGLHPVRRPGEYTGLIRRLFRSHSALAVIGIGHRSRSAEAVRGIALELGASGHRVVIVTSEDLVRPGGPSVRNGYRMGHDPNVWFWPDGPGASDGSDADVPEEPIELDRLGYLSREFDFVLLNCPAMDTSPSAAETAAMADAAVLVVEASQTSKRRIQDAQQTLESKGVRLAGSILVTRR